MYVYLLHNVIKYRFCRQLQRSSDIQLEGRACRVRVGRWTLRLSGMCGKLERSLHEGIHAQLPQVRHRRMYADVNGRAEGHRHISVRRLVHGSHSLNALMVVLPNREWFVDISAG